MAMKLVKILIISTALTFSLGVGVYSMPVVTSGTDPIHQTTNSDNAFTTWKAQLSSVTTDQLDGSTEVDYNHYISGLNNEFNTIPGPGDDEIENRTVNPAIWPQPSVMEGNYMRMEASGNNEGDFTWSLINPSNAFGFFADDIEGAAITISFEQGSTTLSYTFTTNGGGHDNTFWGISGLTTPVGTVRIHTAEEAGSNTNWDRFSYGVTAVPEYSSPNGFESPMNSGPVTVKKNRVLPLKVELQDETGSPITDTDIVAPPVIQVTYAAGTTSAGDVTDESLSAGWGTEGNQFEYDISTGRWRFNLKTKNYTSPGTYTVSIVSGDEGEYTICPIPATFVIND